MPTAGTGEDDLTSRGSWVPPVDIFENDKHELVLKAELPDVAREDINLRVENNTLTISGHKKAEADVKEQQYRRIERTYGSFSRSFTLPATVDAGLHRGGVQERRADDSSAASRGSQAAADSGDRQLVGFRSRRGRRVRTQAGRKVEGRKGHRVSAWLGL